MQLPIINMIKNILRKTFLGCALLVSFSSHATVIDFLAEGVGNMPDAWMEDHAESAYVNDPASNFFKIRFTNGEVGESITQVSFDLRAGTDANAFFDPSDGNASSDLNGGGRGFGPLIGNETVGLNPSDVTFSLGPNSEISPVLIISFLNDSFSMGDVLSFGIDIDALGGRSEDLAGGLLGAQSVGVSVELAGSCSDNAATSFQQETRDRSSAQVSFCGASRQSVPEPSTWLLLLLGPALIRLARFKG